MLLRFSADPNSKNGHAFVMLLNPWGSVRLRVVEWRATRISDPVERLRYLRLATAHQQPFRRRRNPLARYLALAGVLLALLIVPSYRMSDARGPVLNERTPPRLPDSVLANEAAAPKVWLVEEKAGYEVFSNGLRIETRFATSNQPRNYRAFDGGDLEKSEWRTEVAGIVYHSTESHLAPFEETQNEALQRIGEGLLAYVKRNRSYHYVIDRFGRVFRVVEESDSANHAGMSVWADDHWTYVNLNAGFLGVSFESQTQAEGATAPLNPAQIHAARVLTEMLRSKHRIPARNCVTHAQVSVNPGNMRVGWHTDWGRGFPFEELGLDDNYEVPVPSMYLFGFTYDSVFVEAIGGRLWNGVVLAEERVRQEASARGLSVGRYREILRKSYRTLTVTYKAARAAAVESD